MLAQRHVKVTDVRICQQASKQYARCAAARSTLDVHVLENAPVNMKYIQRVPIIYFYHFCV